MKYWERFSEMGGYQGRQALGVASGPDLLRNQTMRRLRLRHTTRKSFGYILASNHVWVGQQWDAKTEQWVDQTGEYDSAEKAELVLLRNFVDAEFDPTFDH